jgi:putative zinc finger protein
MRHLDEGTIHAWLDGALDADESRRVESHVASCEACAGAVAAARGVVAAASRILIALDDVPGGVIPGSAPPDAATPAVSAAQRRRSADPQVGVHPWWRSVPLRAAAAIVIVAAGALATREAFLPRATQTTSIPVFASSDSASSERAMMRAPEASAATMSQALPPTAEPSAGTAAAPAPQPSSPGRRSEVAAPRPGRPGSRTSAVDGAGEGLGVTPAPARDAAMANARQPRRSEARSEVASAPLAAKRAAELDELVVTSPDSRRDRAAGDSAESGLLARRSADVQQRMDSAARGVKAAPAPSIGGIAGGVAGVAARAEGRTSMRTRAGAMVAAEASSAAATPPSAQQMQTLADKVEHSTPREIAGLRLLTHTVSQLSQGRVVQGRESVERVRYVHTLLYELVPGAQVELVVALPVESVAVRPEGSEESATGIFADSVPVRAEGRVTTIHWREPDGTELQLSGRVSLEELEALRRRVRVPPRKE